MKKLIVLSLIFLTMGCMTFKKIENTYIIHSKDSVLIKEGVQSVTGSDPSDSFNGNKLPTIDLNANKNGG